MQGLSFLFCSIIFVYILLYSFRFYFVLGWGKGGYCHSYYILIYFIIFDCILFYYILLYTKGWQWTELCFLLYFYYILLLFYYILLYFNQFYFLILFCVVLVMADCGYCNSCSIIIYHIIPYWLARVEH